MPGLTDPLEALLSFQRALAGRKISPARGDLDPTILVLKDDPNGLLRLTYARVRAGRVTALVNFVVADPVEPGVPCFNMGYAVHKDLRGQGRAKELVTAAIAELQNGLARNGVRSFHVEAIVGTDNVESQHVAAATVSGHAQPGIDHPSQVPILQYIRRVDVGQV